MVREVGGVTELREVRRVGGVTEVGGVRRVGGGRVEGEEVWMCTYVDNEDNKNSSDYCN